MCCTEILMYSISFGTKNTKSYLQGPRKTLVISGLKTDCLCHFNFSSVSHIYHNLMCSYDRPHNQLWSLAGWSSHFKLQFLPDVLCGGRTHSMEPTHT